MQRKKFWTPTVWRTHFKSCYLGLNIHPLFFPPLTAVSSLCASAQLPLSTQSRQMSHLAHTSHSREDALVVALPWHLTEEKVYLIIIWIVCVCNGMSRNKPGLWRHREEQRKEGSLERSGNGFTMNWSLEVASTPNVARVYLQASSTSAGRYD